MYTDDDIMQQMDCLFSVGCEVMGKYKELRSNFLHRQCKMSIVFCLFAVVASERSHLPWFVTFIVLSYYLFLHLFILNKSASDYTLTQWMQAGKN